MINPMLQMLKLRDGNVIKLVQDHTAHKCWTKNFSVINLHMLFK